MAASQKKEPKWRVARAYPRFLLDLRLVIRTTKEVLHGRTKDIAEGGLGATIPADLSMEEVVGLEFQPAEVEKPLTFMAEVRYRHGFKYGFRFIHATEKQRETIRAITQNLSLAP